MKEAVLFQQMIIYLNHKDYRVPCKTILKPENHIMSNIHTLDSIRRRDESERQNRIRNYQQNQYNSSPMPNPNYVRSNPNRLTKSQKLIYSMIGINCAVYIGWQIYPQFMWKHFILSNTNIKSQRYHVLLTSDWSHQGLIHLVFNMYSLYNNGFSMLNKASIKKFLMLYIGAGIASSYATLLWNVKIRKKYNISSLGASGSLMGLSIVLGLISLYPQWQLTSTSERDLKKKIRKFLVNTTGKDILFLLFLQAFSSQDHAGHLGGALFGWLFWKHMM
eukprot:442805_1